MTDNIDLNELLLTALQQVAAAQLTPAERDRLNLCLAHPSDELLLLMDEAAETVGDALTGGVCAVLNAVANHGTTP